MASPPPQRRRLNGSEPPSLQDLTVEAVVKQAIEQQPGLVARMFAESSAGSKELEKLFMSKEREQGYQLADDDLIAILKRTTRTIVYTLHRLDSLDANIAAMLRDIFIKGYVTSSMQLDPFDRFGDGSLRYYAYKVMDYDPPFDGVPMFDLARLTGGELELDDEVEEGEEQDPSDEANYEHQRESFEQIYKDQLVEDFRDLCQNAEGSEIQTLPLYRKSVALTIYYREGEF